MKIKIGNDIKGLKWLCNQSGDPFDWSLAQDLVIYAHNSLRPEYKISPSVKIINGNTLELCFESKDCRIGSYFINAQFHIPDPILPDGKRDVSVDWINAFTIVEHSSLEDTEGAEFTTDLKFGLDGKSSFELWLLKEGNEGKTYEEYETWLREPAVKAADDVDQLMQVASQQLSSLMTEVAEHPTYVGQDNYVYVWNHGTHSYNKTNVYVKGDPFSITKVYTSVLEMQEDFGGTDTKPGDFVLIETGDVEDPDNSKMYLKTELQWTFVTDLSGAIGFTGKTPQFSIGTITTGAPGSEVIVTLSEDGVDLSGNPKFKLNFSIPQGNQGIQGIQGIQGLIGKSAYLYYYENTTDDPKLTEQEFGLLHSQIPENERQRQNNEQTRIANENERINAGAVLKTQIKQTGGESALDIMSQKACTDSFQQKYVGSALTALFVSRGAVYNHLTGFYELNGLTDLTEAEMMDIYNVSANWGSSNTLPYRFEGIVVRTLLQPKKMLFSSFSGWSTSIERCFYSSTNLKSVSFVPQGRGAASTIGLTNISWAFYDCQALETIYGMLHLANLTAAQNAASAFYHCYALKTLVVASLKVSISFADSPNLSKASILDLISNSAATGAIVITLHATAYAMAIADTTIQNALTAKPYVSLASA